MKFIRFAQQKIDAKGDGIVGVITNRWWLENVTFRGMRQSLLNTFDQIYIFDLNGEAGLKNDKNVFDITKGVAIAIFVKNSSRPKRYVYRSFIGSRIEKYKLASLAGVTDKDWVTLSPNTPNYFLVPRSDEGRVLYETFYSTPAIFSIGSTGVLTGNDGIAVFNSQADIVNFLNKIIDEDPIAKKAAGTSFKQKDLPDIARIGAMLRSEGVNSELMRSLAYRPFDKRFYYDHDAVIFRRRKKIMSNLNHRIPALSVCRLTKGEPWCHVFVSDSAADDSFVSDKSKERAYVYPLKISTDESSAINSKDKLSRHQYQENLAPAFRSFLDAHYDHHYSPEEILGYIYAVLHAPFYRQRYAEFLRIDFPRIPFARARKEFDALALLGDGLINAHLLRKQKRQGLAELKVKGSNVVEAVRYSPQEQAIYINKTQHFAPVPQNVWEFHIGGYQVIDKYLKSRKTRELSLDEINLVGAIADSLAFTIAQMAKIDVAYQAAFPLVDKA